jgi:hypothetical protein
LKTTAENISGFGGIKKNGLDVRRNMNKNCKMEKYKNKK